MTTYALFEGEYEINDIYMGTPCVIGRSGIKKKLQVPLNKEESEAMKGSARTLNDIINQLNI